MHLSKLIAALILVCAILTLPCSATWTIQDPDYSGFVVFNPDNTGYVHVEGLIPYTQYFTYSQLGQDTYQAKTILFGKTYTVPFRKMGDMITSPDFAQSSLVWTPQFFA